MEKMFKKEDLIDYNKYNGLEEELLPVDKLYYGKLGYRSGSGKFFEHNNSFAIVRYNIGSYEFEDVLNFETYYIDKQVENNITSGKLAIHNLVPVSTLLNQKGIKYEDYITRKELRKAFSIEEVKDAVLKKIIDLSTRIDESFLGNNDKLVLKNLLLNVLDNYEKKVVSNGNNKLLSCEVRKIAFNSLRDIENMIPCKDIEEFKEDSKQLRKKLIDNNIKTTL